MCVHVLFWVVAVALVGRHCSGRVRQSSQIVCLLSSVPVDGQVWCRRISLDWCSSKIVLTLRIGSRLSVGCIQHMSMDGARRMLGMYGWSVPCMGDACYFPLYKFIVLSIPCRQKACMMFLVSSNRSLSCSCSSCVHSPRTKLHCAPRLKLLPMPKRSRE